MMPAAARNLLLKVAPAIVAGIACAVLGCGRQDSIGRDGRLHPVAANIESAIPVTNRVPLRDRSGQIDLGVADSADASWGSESGPPDSVFGQIGDIAEDSHGTLLVLDERMAEVRAIGRSGWMQRVGRAGQGPGEFTNAQAIAVGADDRLYVGDLRRSIQVFRPEARGWVFERELPVELSPRAMCVLGTDLVVGGYSAGDPSLVRVYAPDGRLKARFGALYRTDNPIVASQTAAIRLLCDRVHSEIVLAPRSLIGEIRSYGPDGTLRWRTALDDYQPIVLRERADHATVVEIPADGFDRLQSLTQLPSGDLLVQIAHLSAADARAQADFSTLYSMVLRGGTGALVTAGRGDRVFAWFGPGVAISVANVPYPKVSAWSIVVPMGYLNRPLARMAYRSRSHSESRPRAARIR